MKWVNLVMSIALLGFAIYDAVTGQWVWFAVNLVVAALALLWDWQAFRKDGGTITTFEQGETEVLTSLSKGLEPAPIPGESDRPPHQLGTDPECGICRSIMERDG